MTQKRIFKRILAITAIILAILPLLVTFAAILTQVFDSMGWYRWLQETVVPFEARLVAVVIRPVGIKALVAPEGSQFAMLLQRSGGDYLPVNLSWNCLGWQSLLLLALTLATGLQGSFTFISKLEVVVFGVLGTFLSNILRARCFSE